MRFKQFILEQTQYTYPHVNEVTKNDVAEWIKKNAKAHVAGLLRGGTPIWRGMHIGAGDHLYGIGDASKFVRHAANTSNYTNLIVSNSPKWKDYPKRQSAYICTTDFQNTHNFGDPYLVIPADNAPIGIVPAFDFWYGFKEIHKMFRGLGIETLNETIHTICERLGYGSHISDEDLGYDELKEILFGISKEDIEETIVIHPDTGRGFRDRRHQFDVEFHNEWNGRITSLIKNMDYRDTLYSFIEDLLDPAKSNFRHTTGATFYSPNEFEVWVGDKAAFISISEISPDGEDGTPENIAARLKEWLNEI